MRKLVIVLLYFFVFTAFGPIEAGKKFEKIHGEKSEGIGLPIKKSILENSKLEMVVKKGMGRFDNTLAMDIESTQIPILRGIISESINRKLDFFKLWNPEGEAHVTVINPVEYYDFLMGDPSKPIISMDEIGQIALNMNIQKSDLEILSIGSGKKLIEGKMEETFFIIVKSENLLNIRKAIHEAFIKNGGNAEAWDPEHFFPHITVGYTLRDLHEADGVLKNVENSCDSRFKIQLQD